MHELEPKILLPKMILREELEKRSSKNPRYSLRAFAKTLGMSHTVLSLILSGKRAVSKKMATRLAEFLDFDPIQKQKLIENRKTVNVRNQIDSDYQQLSLDTFTVISDWYHYAILSLLELSQARFEAKWISKALGITEIQAKLAMDRLTRLKLVEKSKNGKWQQTGYPLKVENTVSTSATRKFQRQLLEKALESLESDPIEKRDFSSMTMAIDPELIPYARDEIQKFRRELARKLESRGNAKAIYNLTVQIYPVSKNLEENSNETK